MPAKPAAGTKKSGAIKISGATTRIRPGMDALVKSSASTLDGDGDGIPFPLQGT